MNRIEFMNQLKKLLNDISPSERQEALDYYNSYFDDAGQENESNVIQELGSPGKVAAIIRADLAEDAGEDGEYTERGYQDSRSETGKMPEVYDNDSTRQQSRAQRGYQAPAKKNSTGNLILLIAVIILSCWIWIPLAGGIFGVLVGILACGVAAVICIGAFALSGIICGVVFGIVGIIQCFTSPALGFMEIAMGFASMAIGLLFALAFAWIALKFLPWAVRGVVSLCQKLLHKTKKGGAPA